MSQQHIFNATKRFKDGTLNQKVHEHYSIARSEATAEAFEHRK